MKEIAVLDTGYDSYDYERDLFTLHDYSLRICDNPQDQAERRIELARNAVGILVRGTVIDDETLKKMPLLQAVVRYGVGYDNIDVAASKARGIRVANVQGYANHAVSDHALALMFACARDLEGSRKGAFSEPSRKDMVEFHDKTLGIIGIGRIGSFFSRKASPLFRHTFAYDPYKTAEYMSSHGATKTDLPALLKESHVISLHCNLTDETTHMLEKTSFSQMGNRSIIINTARGPVISEPDLVKALENDLIHSAGLDVFDQEPPGEAQRQILDHPRIITTPHIAWYSDYAMKELQKRAADNMIALLSGQQIQDEL